MPAERASELQILRPDAGMLPAYVRALEAGWSPDTIRGRAAAAEQLAQIAADPTSFLERLDDPEGRAPDIEMPDGTMLKRLPGYFRWLWDGDFCGSINFRWPPGGAALPPHVLGHIGYAVVPWKRGRGYATRALALLLPDCRARGLTYVELTTDAGNPASQKVILANGGVLVGPYRKPAPYGGGEGLLYRIEL